MFAFSEAGTSFAASGASPLTALRIAAAVAFIASATSANAVQFFNVTVRKAGVQSSTAALTFRGVETFDGQQTGANPSFTTDFGTHA